MTYWKLKYKVLGNHTHVTVFSSSNEDGTYAALKGNLVFSSQEWVDFQNQLAGVGVQFIEDE